MHEKWFEKPNNSQHKSKKNLKENSTIREKEWGGVGEEVGGKGMLENP